jgi:hypothetical protein
VKTYDIGTENIKDNLEPWIKSGFLTLQNWIGNEKMNFIY